MTALARTTLAHPARNTHPQTRRSRSLPSLTAASLAALVLCACGGGDGSASSADSTQSTQPGNEYRSFVSVNPQAKAAIAARPIATKAEDDVEGNLDRNAEGAAESDDAASPEDAADSTSSKDNEGSIADMMISDMNEMNDLPLKDVNPKYGFSRGPGYVIAGVESRGWHHLLPWFVQFEGVGNEARHTRIQMRNLRVFTKSRSSGEWKRLIDADTFDGMQCDLGGNYHNCPQVARVETDDPEGASSLPVPNLNLHGWWGSRASFDGGDLGAVVVSIQARLIANPDGEVDDRDKAEYLMHVGADFYPDDAPHGESLPPVGISRAKLLTSDWQTFTMSTLNDVGLQEPGGGISSSELRDNPPPLN